MIRHGSPISNDDSAVVDLAAFGFQNEDDAWLEAFRAAQDDEPLGRIGDYEIMAEVGRGGQGIVYKARCTKTKRVVAIKRLIGGKFAAADLRRRFEREMQAIESLDHPNITRAVDIDVVEGHPVIIMEWIDGAPLNVWARNGNRRRSIADIVSLFLRVCDAVQHAHIRGVIHRDLKPSNILVTSTRVGDSGDDRPVILDFGMARIIDETEPLNHRTTTGQFVGTLAYAAPEQVGGDARRADALADVYGLGVMLFEALTGALPYRTDGSLADAIQAIQSRIPERPSRIRADITRDLDAIVRKALSKAPTERYQSVDAFAADLQRHLDGDPVSARTPGTLYLAGKLIRRHPIAFGAGFLVFAVVSTLATALYVANERERAALRVAQTTSDFLVNTLAAAEPARGGPDVTLIEVLAQAGHRAERELADMPEAAASVHLAIGNTYSSLWRWRDAIPHLEKSVELIRSQDRRTDDEFADALQALGRAYTSTRNPKAVEIQKEALDIRRALYGEIDARVAESLKELAYAYQQAIEPPQWEAAETHYQDAVAMFRETVGPDHRETASCLHNYGWMRVRQRRYAESIELYRQALEIFRRTDRRNDPFYIECLYGYTAQLSVTRRDAENLEVLDELIPGLRALHGESGIEDLLWSRAETLMRLDRIDEAYETFGEGFVALFGYCGLKVASSDHDANQLCTVLLDHAAEIPDQEFRAAILMIVEFVNFHVSSGNVGQAESILSRIDAAIEPIADDAPLIRASILESRAAIAVHRGSRDQGEALYHQSLSALGSADTRFARKRAWLARQLAVCRLDGHADSAVIGQLQDAYDALVSLYGPEHQRAFETKRIIEQWQKSSVNP